MIFGKSAKSTKQSGSFNFEEISVLKLAKN